MIEKLDARIVKFIKKHHVLTLATACNNHAWCSNCFYAFDEESISFVFTSDENTRHIREITQNNQVSGTIVLETKIIGKIQGMQFSGAVSEVNAKSTLQYLYLKRFPFAILNDTKLWAIELTFAKFTDNTLGFGKKLLWHRTKS
jgi:uncharacterized protein